MACRRHTVILIVAGVLTAALGTSAPALAQAPVSEGQRVRITLAGNAQVVGLVSQVDAESLSVIVAQNMVPVNLALADIRGLERSIGQQHQGKKWATYGALAGAGLGILSGMTWVSWGAGTTGIAAGLYVGAVNALWMGGAGYLAGRYLGQTDIWQPVSLDRSGRQGFRLMLGIGRGPDPEVSPVLVGVSIPWR